MAISRCLACLTTPRSLSCSVAVTYRFHLLILFIVNGTTTSSSPTTVQLLPRPLPAKVSSQEAVRTRPSEAPSNPISGALVPVTLALDAPVLNAQAAALTFARLCLRVQLPLVGIVRRSVSVRIERNVHSVSRTFAVGAIRWRWRRWCTGCRRHDAT